MWNYIKAKLRQPELVATFEPQKLKRKPKKRSYEELLKPEERAGSARRILWAIVEANGHPLSGKEICDLVFKRKDKFPIDFHHRLSDAKKMARYFGTPINHERRTGCNFHQYWMSTDDCRELKRRMGR